MSKPLVYLAGPITGLSYGDATDWREKVASKLAAAGIKGLSPMRAKDYLKDVKEFTMDGEAYRAVNILSSNRGIVTRDRWDATRADAILVNFLGATRVSIGTVMEIAWGDLARVPVVCAMEPAGNPHDHGMICETIVRVPTLEEAVFILKAMFC